MSDGMTAAEKVNALTSAAANKTPDEIRALYKRLGKVEFTAWALACASRFRGLEHVKALVENGATFNYIKTDIMTDRYRCSDMDYTLSVIYFGDTENASEYENYFYSMRRTDFGNFLDADSKVRLPVLPLGERKRIAVYLYEHSETTGFDGSEPLYYSILSGNYEMADALKAAGVTLSEERRKMLSAGGRGITDGMERWTEYSYVIGGMSIGDFVKMSEYFRAELGGVPLHFTEAIYAGVGSRCFYKPEIFKFFLANFNQSKMNKSKILKVIIKNNLVADLDIAAGEGWLDQPRKRDEMIAFASEGGYTEASAWLLDFKNRTADLAAERERAERRMQRELNAAPDSVSELKKIWSYKKREDGALVITSYKGGKTEISVPAKIGKDTIAAIGAYAFSPSAPRVREEQAAVRRKIQRITLPDTVKEIGECAFFWCEALEEVDIPDGVTEIRGRTFAHSGLKRQTLPASVRSIGESAFWGCVLLESINIPEGVPDIGKYTFGACRALKEIDIPGSVEKIGTGAFQGCFALERISIREGTAEIGREAFVNCAALSALELPSSISRITNFKRGDITITPFYKKPGLFENMPELILTVPPKSYAERYCKRVGLAYKLKEI